MHDWLRGLRVTHKTGKIPHPLRVWGLEPAVRQYPLEILVPVEPR
jgi:hypothetical protein